MFKRTDKGALRHYEETHLREYLYESDISSIKKYSLRLFTKYNTFLYYCFCGGLATFFDWTTFYLVIEKLKLNYFIAVTLSFALGSIVNYTFNKLITFNNKHKNIVLQFSIYLCGALSALLFTYCLMIFLIEFINISPMLSRIMTTGIMLIYNYLFHQKYTFGKLQ